MRYAGPGTIIDKPGADYGPLWTNRYPIAIVLHTTETEGLPSYSSDDDPDMEYNPKLTIDTRRKIVYVHTDLDRRDGALRGTRRVFDDTGVWTVMNEKAINIEIIAYSDARIAGQRPDRRLAVRDLTDDDYEFLAQVVAWVKKAMNIGDDITPQPAGYPGWRYGLDSPVRGTHEQWEQLDGLTAHGWVFGQSHWDTDGMDLVRIWTRAKEINGMDIIGLDDSEIAFIKGLISELREGGGNERSLVYVLEEYRLRAKAAGVGGHEVAKVAAHTLATKEHVHRAEVKLT